MTEFGTLEMVTEAGPKEKEEGLTDSQPQTTTPNNSHCPEQNKPSSQTAVPQSTTDLQTNIAGKYK